VVRDIDLPEQFSPGSATRAGWLLPLEPVSASSTAEDGIRSGIAVAGILDVAPAPTEGARRMCVLVDAIR
jgi:hypothetical protein